tara:strand:- start:12 stop:536 length:525 start_codon:yes stop_codon:yes gene_type:complete
MTRSKIRTSGAEGLTLSSTDITVASGDLLFGASAKGVNLGVTSNTDANTLDDYEEGTWTPTLPNGGTVNSNYKSIYIKVGDLVYFYAYIVVTPTNDNADFRIGGLPFTPVSNNHGIGSIGYSHVLDTHYWSSPLVHPSSYMYFHRVDGNSDTIKNAEFGGNQRSFIVGGVYTLT